MISNITSDDRRTAEESNHHVPVDLVATDHWDGIFDGHRTFESGYIDASTNPDILETFEDVSDSEGEFSPDEFAYVVYDDDDIRDELSIIYIRDAVDTSGDEPELDSTIDLSPFTRRDAWMGVSPNGRNLIIPVRSLRGMDNLGNGPVSIYTEGKITFAEKGNESLTLIDADETSSIAHGDRWARDWVSDTQDALTDDGSPTWVKQYRSWDESHTNVEELPTPSQTEKEDYLARAIIDHEEMITMPSGDDSVASRPLYRYNPDTGAFESGGTSYLQTMITEWVGGDIAVNRWHQVIDRVKALLSPVDIDELNAADDDRELICVRNGVVDVLNDELLTHDPEYRFTVSLPVEYDPDIDGSAFTDFLGEVTETDTDRKTLEEWVGFTLASGYPLDRFIMLLGEGGNGKSVYLNVIRQLISEDNVSEIALERMTAGDQFGLGPIEGKLLNIDEDTTGEDFYGSQLSKLKKLSAGERIPIEYKGVDRYFVRNTAKLALAANKPPRLVDESENALARRLLWVRFPWEFKEEPTEPHHKQKVPYDKLMESLTSDEVKPGILNIAIEGLQRLLEQGCFSKEIGKDEQERYAEYMRLADDITAFEQEMLEPASGHGLPTEVIYSVYVAQQNARMSPKVLSKSVFFKALNKKGSGYWFRGQYTDGEGNRPRALFGVTFSDWAYKYLTEDARDEVHVLYNKSRKLSVDDEPSLKEDDDDENDPGVDVVEMSQMQRIAKIIGKLDEKEQVSVGQLAGELQLPPEQVEGDLSGLAECGEVIRTVDDGQVMYVR